MPYKDKDKANEANRKSYHKNKEKNKTINSEKCKKYRLKNLDYLRNKDKKRTERLDISYLRRNLIQQGYTLEQLSSNPEIFKIKSIIIKTQRLCKTLNN